MASPVEKNENLLHYFEVGPDFDTQSDITTSNTFH